MGETAAVSAVSRNLRGDTPRAVRRRAVGTRDRIIAHLAVVAEIADGAGMASTRLAEAVGYPGSSVAFAQLLSGMERDGLISREVRGKRTYRIALSTPASLTAPAADLIPPQAEEVHPAGVFPAKGIDYDELADRVLVRLLRRLAELNPAELAALERLLVPGHAPAAELDLLPPDDADAPGLGSPGLGSPGLGSPGLGGRGSGAGGKGSLSIA